MIFNSPCATCVRFNREDRSKDACSAFPQGIPLMIFEGEVDHQQPFAGDHGLQYEPNAAAKQIEQDGEVDRLWSEPTRRDARQTTEPKKDNWD